VYLNNFRDEQGKLFEVVTWKELPAALGARDEELHVRLPHRVELFVERQNRWND
jgi:hypothetical protein